MSLQALVMGFGGTGAHILTFLKELTVLKGERPDSVRFLLFDTIADWEPGSTVKILGGAAEEKLAQGREEGTSLDPHTEYFYLEDHDPDLKKYVFDLLEREREHYPHLRDWLHAPWLGSNIPERALDIKEGAAQQRQIGRFAMFQNSELIVQQIQQELRKLDQKAQKAPVNIWIVGSAAGGTGAGCMLDAAFMTRLAAKGFDYNLTGVIVLPEVYRDKSGIDLGRAYSMFRELDRVQEVGVRYSDRYFYDGERITSRVAYDRHGRYLSLVKSKLFDYLFYVGQECRSDERRESFFSSVANSIDPYLDTFSGRPLLEASLNDNAAAASFGAARLYIPIETLKEIFAWEEARRYLQSATDPQERDSMVVDLHTGSFADRREKASQNVKALLPLFGKLLDLTGKTDREIQAFARGLHPKRIVQEWYGLAGTAIAGLSLTPAEEQEARITYVNPYVSLTEDDPGRVPPQERVLQTYGERKKAKGSREKPGDSRDRFLREIGSITERYKSEDAGQNSFERGRRLVLKKVSQLLQNKIDDLVINELNQNPKFGRDPEASELGTTMTRLFREFRECLSDGGPLRQIDRTVSLFIDTLRGEQERHQQDSVITQQELKDWTKGGIFGFGSTSVDELQTSARDAAAEYIHVYQRYRLLQDMQRLIREVRGRFESWASSMRSIFEGLVLDPSSSGYKSTRDQLRRLSGRLSRLGKNPSALISCDQDRAPDDPDISLQGYRERLREDGVAPDGTSLGEQALEKSGWAVTVDSKGQPSIELEVTLKEGTNRYDMHRISQLHRDLYRDFKEAISKRLDSRDIFDYLLFAQRPPHNVEPKQIAQMLTGAAAVLINATAPEDCRFVYKDPVGPEKRNLADSILKAIDDGIGANTVSDAPHSDAYSITLMKIKKPNLDDINNVIDCRNEYLRWQTDEPSGEERHDKELARTQVFHPFRPELEAWFIERTVFIKRHRNIQPSDHIPPRLARLLENPAKMQAFVRCIATGAVEKNGDNSWVWHDTENSRQVMLTDGANDSKADLVQAAVVFGLREQEGKPDGLIRIALRDAVRSAVAAAQQKHAKVDEAMRIFIDNELDAYLKEHLNDEMLHPSMRIIFEFYGDPQTHTQLRDRLY